MRYSSVSAKHIHSCLWGAFLFCCTTLFSVSHAATVAIDSLLINSVSLTVTVPRIGGDTLILSTPAQINMGEYKDPIFLVGGGHFSARVYSTGAFDMPPPSGTVDTVAGTIDVDFSSLRANVTSRFGYWDIPLSLATISPVRGTYNPGTDAFALTWSNPFNISLGSRLFNGTASISLSGTTTLVPVPAALWLLGSGLLGMAGIARRHKFLMG